MRFLNVDIVSFTNARGRTVALHDLRPTPIVAASVVIDVNTGDQLPEIASRDQFYGVGGEFLYFQIADANVIKLIDYKYDLGKVRKLGVPL